mgnify:FL=1
MLFPWEVERLISLIKDENNGQHLSGQDFTFDKNRYEIAQGNQTSTHNIGSPIQVSLNDVKNSETHLQAYLLNNNFLPQIFGKNIVWIGNEVFAGSGMQKIDIYRIIELKHPKSGIGVNFAPMQLEYYINWAREDIGGHIIGGRRFNIKPVLLCLTGRFNSIPDGVIKRIQALGNISNSPEIWEMDFILDIQPKFRHN